MFLRGDKLSAARPQILDFGFWIEERHRKFPKHNFMLICSLKHVYQKNHDRNSLFHEIVVQ
jgi:hypothetical protein